MLSWLSARQLDCPPAQVCHVKCFLRATNAATRLQTRFETFPDTKDWFVNWQHDIRLNESTALNVDFTQGYRYKINSYIIVKSGVHRSFPYISPFKKTFRNVSKMNAILLMQLWIKYYAADQNKNRRFSDWLLLILFYKNRLFITFGASEKMEKIRVQKIPKHDHLLWNLIFSTNSGMNSIKERGGTLFFLSSCIPALFTCK